MEMGHYRHRTLVAIRSALEMRVHVSAGHAARRICPVQSGIDWQQMAQERSAAVPQTIDPFDPNRSLEIRLEGERGVIEGARVTADP